MTDLDSHVSYWGRLTCRDFIELVTDYLEDALPPSVRAEFGHHLRVCTGCQVYLDQMRDTIRLTRRSGGAIGVEAPLSEAARGALFDAFRQSIDSD